MHRFSRVAAIFAFLVFGVLIPPPVSAAGIPGRAVQPAQRMPAEYERQDAILLAWDETDQTAQKVQVNIIRSIWRKVPVIFVVNTADAQLAAAEALLQARIPRDAVRFVRVPVDTVWARDYGPSVVKNTLGGSSLVNAEYERSERPNDDDVPLGVAPLLGMTAIDAALRIQGGNLLSNGAGLCVTTNKVLDENVDRGYQQKEVEQQLRANYGAREILFLEPLIGEQTGHVDMFATFTGINTVIVGEYAADVDPINAEILDRNAERLSRVVTSSGPMKVLRIPMPRTEFNIWRTYTNVLYANGILLVPIYPGIDLKGRQQALAVYREALPTWRIVGINCNYLINSGGAIHCLSLNLASVQKLPATMPLDGRPDPARKFPFAGDGRIIVENNGIDREPATGETPPSFPAGKRPWLGNPLTAGLRKNRSEMPPFDRMLEENDGPDIDEFTIDAPQPAREIRPGWALRNRPQQQTQWQSYQASPQRLREYDRERLLSILRGN